MSRITGPLAQSASDFLTERINEIDKISGLRLGAWDYLPKPISLDYLAERISSLLKLMKRSALSKQTRRLKKQR